MTNRPQIAIVTTDTDLGYGVMRTLETCSMHVSVHFSTETYLRSIASAEPDCLLLDVDERNNSRVDLVNQLLDNQYYFPVIFISTRIRTDLQHLTALRRVAGVLAKPVDHVSLIELVRVASRWHELYRISRHHLPASSTSEVRPLHPPPGGSE